MYSVVEGSSSRRSLVSMVADWLSFSGMNVE